MAGKMGGAFASIQSLSGMSNVFSEVSAIHNGA